MSRMKSYFEVLRQPGVGRLVASQLCARFPAGMLSLAILMHIEQSYGNYSAAGLIMAAMGVGQAISGPLSSRLMARFGMRLVVGVTILSCSLGLAGLALFTDILWVSAVLAALIGLAMPPITPAVRTIYPKVVPASFLSKLFSVDATLQELIWVIGPLVATTTAFLGSTMWGVLLCSIIMFLGGAWFWTAPEVGLVRIPRSKYPLGAVLANPVVLIMTILGLFMTGVFAGIETAVVATFGHDRAETGIIIGLSAVGSIVGGFAFGHRPVTPLALVMRCVPFIIGAAMCCLWHETWWLAVAFILTGVGCAPLISGSFAAVSSSVRFSQTAESYGWMGTGQLVGGAASSAIAGVAIDTIGPQGGYLTGLGFAIASLLLILVTWGFIPDLRGRDATPHPDTEPIGIIVS